MGIDPFLKPLNKKGIVCKGIKAEKIDRLKKEFDIIYSIKSLYHFESLSTFLEKLALSGQAGDSSSCRLEKGGKYRKVGKVLFTRVHF